ncbi:MAG: Gx transporter family protein [Atopobiaceae bacterium]|nr:Gx transporter family protein [Atopobiaceae bacterium]
MSSSPTDRAAASSDNTLSDAQRTRWARTGVLAAFALALSYLETFIPIPIPGVKLGLANLPVLLSLAQHDRIGACYIAAIKVVAAGLLFGSPVSLAFSAVGTAMSLAVMAALSLLPTMRLEMVSVVGALAHEAGQLVVAMLILGTPLVWYSAPVLAVAGSVCGLVLGVVAAKTAHLVDGSTQHDYPGEQPASSPEASRQPASSSEASQQPASPMGVSALSSVSSSEASTLSSVSSSEASTLPPFSSLEASALPPFSADTAFTTQASTSAKLIFAGFAVFCVAVLRVSRLSSLLVLLTLAVIFLLVSRAQFSSVAKALLPTVPFIVVSAIAQILSTQTGVPVITFGTVLITSDALMTTVTMALRLLALVGISVAVTATLDAAQLVSVVAWILSPFRKLGLSLDGPLLALSCALRLAPSLALGFRSEFSLRDDVVSPHAPANRLLNRVAQFVAEHYLGALDTAENNIGTLDHPEHYLGALDHAEDSLNER